MILLLADSDLPNTSIEDLQGPVLHAWAKALGRGGQ